MIECVIHYKATSAAGVENSMVGVLDTGAIKIGSGECSCMEGGPKDSLILAICTLMYYPIVDVEVVNVLGDTWSLIRTDEGKGVVAAVARVIAHPFSPWVVSVPFLSLSGGMSHPCWISGVAEESRWGVIDRSFIFGLYVWFNDVGKDRDIAEM